ncbi:MAG: TetR/AcrR family transcriptional regulator [Prevotella sp.]|nr:TetR/AcrR family transcriptional regulator [Prevotella sp.]
MQKIKTISAYKEGLREKILDTAIRSFARRGIRAVKMDDIAAELSISKRTLYEIFENKEVLLYEGVKYVHLQRHKQMEEMTSGCPDVMHILFEVYRMKAEEFRNMCPDFLTDLEKYPRVHRYLVKNNQEQRQRFMKFLDRGIQEGYFRADVNYELAARLFEALGNYIMTMRLFEQFSPEEMFNNMIIVSLRGFCTMKGIETLDKLFN